MQAEAVNYIHRLCSVMQVKWRYTARMALIMFYLCCDFLKAYWALPIEMSKMKVQD